MDTPEITSIPDIIKYISEAFNIPISTGNISKAKARGIYKILPKTIRLRMTNNLPTVCHELGHYFDVTYELSSLDSISEAVNAADHNFLSQYTAAEQPGEAVAEFVRIYMQNKKMAQSKAPNFYNAFVNSISAADLKKLDTAAKYVNQYMTAGFSERLDSAIVSSKDDVKPSLEELRKYWYMKVIDGFDPLKDASDYVKKIKGNTLDGSKDAFVLATNSRNAATITEQNIKRGLVDLNGDVVGKSFFDCIKGVSHKNLPALDKYLVLRHSLEWLTPQTGENATTPKRVFADETLQDISLIKKEISRIEKKFPEMKQAAENLYEYQRQMMEIYYVGGGGMTSDFANYLNKRYPNYVPFQRAVGSGKGKTKSSFANQKVPIHRAKGSGASIISPLESIVKNTDKAVKFALRNRTMQALTSYADEVEGFGQFMESVPPDKIPHTVGVEDYKKKIEKALEGKINLEDFATVTNALDDILGDSVTGYSPVAKAGKNIVTVLKDGVPKYYQVHNQMLYEAVAELAPAQLSGLYKLSNTIMTPIKLLITQNNPLFSIPNAKRDYDTAYKNSIINNPAEFAKRYAEAFRLVVTNSDLLKQYKALGGGHSSELSATRDLLKKNMRELAAHDMGKAQRFIRALLHPVDTISDFNDMIETVPRLLEFKAVLEKTGDKQKAIFAADDITTNFKRSGVTGRYINAVLMFNNAQLQGLDKTLRTFGKDVSKKERLNRILKYLFSALFTSAILAWWNRDNDEEGYKNLSSYTKNSFYSVSIGNGRFIKIPKAREVALLDSLTERVIDYAFGDKEAFYKFGEYAASQIIPPFLPAPSDFSDLSSPLHRVAGSTVLGPFVDIVANKNFMGNPIVGRAYADMPKRLQYNEKTTHLAKKMGDLTGQSPMQIDHIISGYGGILGTLNKALLPSDGEGRDWTAGAKTRFVADSNYSTDVTDKVYTMRDSAIQRYAKSPSPENAALLEKWSLAADFIAKANKSIQQLPDNQKRDARLDLIRAVNDWEVEVSALDKKIMNNSDNDSFMLKNLPPIKLEFSRNKIKFAYTLSPKEYKQYADDVMQELNIQRERALKVHKDYRTAALEKASSNAKSIVKERYLQKYANKLKKQQ